MGRHGKAILSLDKQRSGETAWLLCCWDDCEDQGVTLHQVVVHAHAKGYACDHPLSKHVRYVFCSERHRQLFMHGHVAYGKLPLGEHGRIL
jgi:hypothetical protein